jgi:hypothetical protein
MHCLAALQQPGYFGAPPKYWSGQENAKDSASSAGSQVQSIATTSGHVTNNGKFDLWVAPIERQKTSGHPGVRQELRWHDGQKKQMNWRTSCSHWRARGTT